MDNLSVQFRPWRICLGHVFYLGKEAGKIIYLLWNFPTIIVTIQVYGVLLMRLFIGENADHHFVGMQWARKLFWVRIGSNNQLSVLLKFENTC